MTRLDHVISCGVWIWMICYTNLVFRLTNCILNDHCQTKYLFLFATGI